MEKGRIKNGDAVFNATVSSEEALQQEMCLNDVPLKVRGVAFLLELFIMTPKNFIPVYVKSIDMLLAKTEAQKKIMKPENYLISKRQRIKLISEDIQDLN